MTFTFTQATGPLWNYFTHHAQRIVSAAVRANAKNAREKIRCLKMSMCAAA